MTLLAWIALVLFVVGSVGDALVGRSALIVTDALTQWAPWAMHHPGVDVVNNPLPGDTIDSVAPSTMLLAEGIRSGAMEYWNPFLAGGALLGVIPSHAILSPLTIPWLVLPPEFAPAAVKVLEIAVAALGFVLLARRLCLHPASAPIMTIAFCASGFMVAWTNWPQTRVAVLLPLLLWAVDRAVLRRRLLDLVPLALVMYAMLAGGFPAIVAYGAFFGVAWAVVRLIASRADVRSWLRGVGTASAGATLGVALAAVTLLPYALASRQVVDWEARGSRGEHLDWEALATLFAPDVFGTPSSPAGYVGPGNAIEELAAVGAAALAIIVVGLVRRGRVAPRGVAGFLLATTIVLLGAIYAGGPLLDALQALPTMSSSHIGRTRAVVALTTALMLGIGVTAMLSGPADGRSRPRMTAAAVATSALALTGGAMVAFSVVRAIQTVEVEHGFAAKAAAVTAGVVFLVAAVAAVAATRTRHAVARGVAVAIVLALVTTQGTALAATWWTKSDVDTVYPTTETHDWLSDHLGDARYGGVGLTMLNGTASAYELRSVTGRGFHMPTWAEVLEAAAPGSMLTGTFSVLWADGITSPALDRLAVRYAVLDPAATIPGAVEVDASATERTPLADPVASRELEGPVRGVRFAAEVGALAVGAVRAVADDGTVLATTRVELAPGDDATRWTALDLDDVADDETYRVDLDLEPGAGALVDTRVDDGAWWVEPVRPIEDGLSIETTGEATVLGRDTALERFRWSDSAEVLPDAGDRLAELTDGSLPHTTAILGAPPASALEAGSSATIDAVVDDGSEIVLDVAADGAGIVTIADALQLDGWHATIDGEEVALVDVDHALVGVEVPAGEHRIRLHFSLPGLDAGTWVTAAASVFLVAIVLLDLRRRRAVRRRVRAGRPPLEPDTRNRMESDR